MMEAPVVVPTFGELIVRWRMTLPVILPTPDWEYSPMTCDAVAVELTLSGAAAKPIWLFFIALVTVDAVNARTPYKSMAPVELLLATMPPTVLLEMTAASDGKK